jgi:hypothetical protein
VAKKEKRQIETLTKENTYDSDFFYCASFFLFWTYPKEFGEPNCSTEGTRGERDQR